MQFAELKPFFEDNTVWNSDLEIYWYELMWEVLKNDKKFGLETNKNRHDAYLMAIALVDLYREFTQYAQDEHWSEGELIIENIKNFDYEDICIILNIPKETIHDFYSDEEILIEGWNEDDIQRVLVEERSSFQNLYFMHAAERYRNRILFIIRQKYSLIDLFSLMVNTFASGRYGRPNYWDDEDMDDHIEDMRSFASSALRKQDDFLSNMDFIRGFEWLDDIF